MKNATSKHQAQRKEFGATARERFANRAGNSCSDRITLAEYMEKIFRPMHIREAQRTMAYIVGWKPTCLVWFNGRYRAMPH